MKFYQIKMVRKNTKPPVWRRGLVPAGITFAQLALILEDMLDMERSADYEFEFNRQKVHVRELREGTRQTSSYNYSFFHAPDTFLKDCFVEGQGFRFSVGSEDVNSYRITVEKTAASAKYSMEDGEHQVEFPIITKEIGLQNEESWSDGMELNRFLQVRYSASSQTADYRSFPELLKEMENGKFSLAVCEDGKSRTEKNEASADAQIKELADRLRHGGISGDAAWLKKCITAGSMLYYIMPERVLYNLYRQKKELQADREAFGRLLEQLPEETKKYRQKDGSFWFGGPDSEQYEKETEKEYPGCSYYIPTEREIEAFAAGNYTSINPAYEKLREFFESRGILKQQAEMFLRLTQVAFSMGNSETELLGMFRMNGLGLKKTEEELLKQLLRNAGRNTRSNWYRGHTEAEMFMLYRQPGAMPADSTDQPLKALLEAQFEAAKEAPKELPAAEKPMPAAKIYPNDPCPCGSGKKYKKCCGKRG